jgi:hypothetical protein
VTQATGQPIFNPPVPQQVMPYHPTQMQTVQSQAYPPAIRMYSHDGQQQQQHIQYIVPTPPSTTPSPGQSHQQTAFHPGAQPPQAAGPQQGFQPQGQYVMLMHGNPPPFVTYNNPQHPQQFQIVSNAIPQQQHPQQ